MIMSSLSKVEMSSLETIKRFEINCLLLIQLSGNFQNGHVYEHEGSV